MATNPTGSPAAPSSPTSLNMSAQQQQQLNRRRSLRQEFHTRNRYYIAERPPVVSAVILDGGWVTPFVDFASIIDLRRWFCLRCSTVQQSAILAHEQQPGGYEIDENFSSIVETDDCMCWWTRENRKRTCVLLTLVSLIDAVTFGLPCGPIYPGMGTVCLGCQTRWNVRKKYRLKGFGYEDCCAYALFPMCAVQQQAAEMHLRGIPEPPNPCFMVVN